jgi:hypothetical protein
VQLCAASFRRRAREVVITSASPSITTVSRTRHTVASARRGLGASSTAVTVTVACTVSPGRTGREKRICWLR